MKLFKYSTRFHDLSLCSQHNSYFHYFHISLPLYSHFYIHYHLIIDFNANSYAHNTSWLVNTICNAHTLVQGCLSPFVACPVLLHPFWSSTQHTHTHKHICTHALNNIHTHTQKKIINKDIKNKIK